MERAKNIEYRIREMKSSEYQLLEVFLYEAIFQQDNNNPLPRSIIKEPELQVYIEQFGKEDDHCLVAEVEGNIVGAVWTRLVKGYGNVDSKTPEFAISIYKEYRGLGIGTSLMKSMLQMLKEQGYQQASLAVQQDNYALRMYEKVGFYTVKVLGEEYLMLHELNELYFEKLTEQHKVGLLSLWDNWNVIRYTMIKGPLTEVEVLSRIGQFSKEEVYVVKDNAGVIGIVGCIPFYEEKLSYGFFYQIKEEYWGKGIGKEAAKWMLGHMLTVDKNASIYADVVEENIASVKILISLGFEQIGIELNKFHRGNEQQNVIKYRKELEKGKG